MLTNTKPQILAWGFVRRGKSQGRDCAARQEPGGNGYDASRAARANYLIVANTSKLPLVKGVIFKAYKPLATIRAVAAVPIIVTPAPVGPAPP